MTSNKNTERNVRPYIVLKYISASELDDIKVPVGGGQLTRVRLQSAKALQDGALTATDRLEHLDPMIVEMFHTLMDLLEVDKIIASS